MRKNRIFIAAFLLLITLFVLSVNSSAADTATWEGDFFYKVVDGEAIIRRVDSTGKKHIVIPETLGGYPVTSLNMETYAATIGRSVTAITLPKTIKVLENINKMDDFKQIYVDSLETWLNIKLRGNSSSCISGATLYVDGKAVTDVVVPDSVTVIDHYVFGLKGFKSVTFSESIQSVSDVAFSLGCVEKIYVPDIETWFRICNIDIPMYAEIYINNEKPVDIVLPEGIDIIPNRAFADLHVKSITFTTPIKEFGYNWILPYNKFEAFYVDSFETWMNFEHKSGPLQYEKCLYIDGEPVTGDYVFPSTCTRISKKAFAYYDALNSITLHSGIEHIGDNAFYGTGIENVYVDSLETWLKICDNIYTSNGKATYYANPMHHAQNLYVAGELLVDLVIPESVTRIPVYGLYNIKTIESVTFHSGVTSADLGSFINCTNIKEVYVPDIETFIRVSAVKESCNLDTIYINGEPLVNLVVPEGVTDISSGTFSNYDKLESVTFNHGGISIGNNCFSGCDNLKNVYADSLDTWLGIKFADGASNPMTVAENLYINGSVPEDIVLDGSVTEIPAYAFKNCKSLKTVTLHGKITSIAKGAFSGCNNLKDVYIDSFDTWFGIKFADSGSNPMTVAENLYINGSSVENLVLDDSITEIPANAFKDCKIIKTVTVNDKITSIGQDAFSGCPSIESVYAPSIESWLSIEFATGSSNPLFNGAVLYIDGKPLTDLEIPESVSQIKPMAFYGYAGIKNLILSGKPLKMGEAAFNKSSQMQIQAKTIEDWFNVTFESDDYTGYSNPMGYGATLNIGGSPVETLVIPESVKLIPSGAFENCKTLKKITIPATTSIGSGAFSGSSLKEAVVGSLTEKAEPVAVITAASLNCSSLEKITFGYGVKRIENRAFYKHSNLKEVVFYSGIEEIGKNAFYKTGLIGVVIPSTVKLIDEYAFASCGSLTALTVGDDVGKPAVMEIKNYAFSYCGKLAKVTFNSGIKRMLKNVFYKSTAVVDFYVNDLPAYLAIAFLPLCEAQATNPNYFADNMYIAGEPLKSNLVIPEGVTRICEYAFSHRGEIETVTFPSTLVEIGEGAFQACNIKNLELPDSLETIEDSAFMSCRSITTLELKANVKHVGLGAFEYCSALKTVYLHPSLSDVSEWAFMECDNIEIVLYSGTEENWNTFITQNKNIGLETVVVYYGYRPEMLNPPKKIEASQITSDSVTLKWSEVSGAGGYRVYIKKDENWKSLKTLQANTYKITGLDNGTKYSFAVKTYISKGAFVLWSTEYAVFDATTKPTTPKITSTSKSTDTIRLNWNKVPGVSGCTVYQYKSGSWSRIATITKPDTVTYTVGNLKAGTTYKFRLRAYKKLNGNTLWSSASSTVKVTTNSPLPKLTATAKITATKTSSSVTLNWNKVAGASGYRVFQKVSGKWKKLTDTSKLTYTVKNLKANTKYTFAVRAYVLDGEKKVLAPKFKTFTVTTSKVSYTPGQVKNVKAKVYTQTVKLSWKKVSNITGYEVFSYNTKTEKYTSLGKTTKTSYTVKKLNPATEYQFAVKAYNKPGKKTYYGKVSSLVKVTTKLAIPTLKVTSTKKGVANVSWTNIAGETGYEVYGSSKKESGYKKIATTKANVIKATKNKLTSKKTYYFKVRAYKTVNGKKIYGSYSAVQGVKVK
ncbi:MAG: leucine-rich repeat protein [Clostridia bacterium]|nr:leucine-rich repeat protein [Clostridia bacterium]